MERKRREQEELERQRQVQLAAKLEVMRKKKAEYLEYQRQVALQRMADQEREIARAMVITCVTLSAPLLHYPARKTVILTFCESPHEFRWGRHLLVMAGFITTTVIFVVSCKDIRTIFGYAGATTSTTLLTILPSLFVIKLTGKEATPSVQRKYHKRRIFAYFLAAFGVVFMFTSTASMIVSQLQKK